jgi:hypothetical protein
LRLSLVSCPVYLSPAATRTKPIGLHQLWRPAPAEESEDDLPDRGREEHAHARPAVGNDDAGEYVDQTGPATRVTIRPHDPRTGDEIRKSEGYECSRCQFVSSPQTS